MAAANAPVKSNLGRFAIFIGYGPFRLFWEGWDSLVDTLRPFGQASGPTIAKENRWLAS